jgi:glycerol-3-phosphate acyltransferase PlsY
MPDWSAVLCGYLLGSVPFAFLLARRGGIDIRATGSGNVGATNVLRITGASRGVAVLLLDVAKGSVAVWLADLAGAGAAARVAAGVAAVVGHVYPVWLRFQGGKGVAVACGVFSVLVPAATASAGAVFLLVVWVTRYVSLGSVMAVPVVPVTAWLTGASATIVLGTSVAATLIVFRHRSNLARIRAGTEWRIGRAVGLSH